MKPVIPLTALDDGDMIGCQVDEIDVLICKVDGQHYAVSNHCSHARQLLSTGKLRGYEISCPLHGARFDVRDGRCLAAPASRPIQTFPVSVEAGKVHVSVDAAEAPPKPQFGPLN